MMCRPSAVGQDKEPRRIPAYDRSAPQPSHSETSRVPHPRRWIGAVFTRAVPSRLSGARRMSGCRAQGLARPDHLAYAWAYVTFFSSGATSYAA
jgi:hypothetical protein